METYVDEETCNHVTKGIICGTRIEPPELNSADVGEDIIRSYQLPF
jgi:hypothetical protein